MAAKRSIRTKDDSNGDRTAATVVVYDAPLMTARGKNQIANWLRRTATLLERHSDELAPRFTARWKY